MLKPEKCFFFFLNTQFNCTSNVQQNQLVGLCSNKKELKGFTNSNYKDL